MLCSSSFSYRIQSYHGPLGKVFLCRIDASVQRGPGTSAPSPQPLAHFPCSTICSSAVLPILCSPPQSQSTLCFCIVVICENVRTLVTSICYFIPRHEGESKDLYWAKLNPSFSLADSLSNLRPWMAPLSFFDSALKRFCYLLFYLWLCGRRFCLTHFSLRPPFL